jgi:hypothetical protein
MDFHFPILQNGVVLEFIFSPFLVYLFIYLSIYLFIDLCASVRVFLSLSLIFSHYLYLLPFVVFFLLPFLGKYCILITELNTQTPLRSVLSNSHKYTAIYEPFV